MPDARETWGRELSEEIEFWRSYFLTRGRDWPDDYDQRLNPEGSMPEYLTCLLPEHQAECRVLDVGSGPISKVGPVCPGRNVTLIAVDALADEYNKLLADFGIVPRVPTLKCEAEKLTEVFDEDYFDVSHAMNSLDHSYNPLEAIRQMVTVTKPGGYVRLEHRVNEGENEEYHGLHQWNFDIRDEGLFVWNRERTINISRAVGSLVEIQLWKSKKFCSVLMRKLASGRS